MPKLPLLALVLLLGTGCHRQSPLEVFGSIPDFALTSSTGQPFRSAESLKGYIWVADFIFTNCPGPCPRITARLRELQDSKTNSAGLRFVSFTIDPARDTPEVLARYARAFHADPTRWYFLTGPQANLHQLTRNSFMVGNVDGSLEHSTRFTLVDRQSRIRGYYDSSDPQELAKLRGDIERLSKEST